MRSASRVEELLPAGYCMKLELSLVLLYVLCGDLSTWKKRIHWNYRSETMLQAYNDGCHCDCSALIIKLVSCFCFIQFNKLLNIFSATFILCYKCVNCFFSDSNKKAFIYLILILFISCYWVVTNNLIEWYYIYI